MGQGALRTGRALKNRSADAITRATGQPDSSLLRVAAPDDRRVVRFVAAFDIETDAHHRLSAVASVTPADRGNVAVIAPDRHPDVALVGAAAMGRIVAGPARARQPRLEPRMARLFAKLGLLMRREIARDIARRHAGETQQADRQMSKVLADARPRFENIVDARIDVRGSGLVVKLIMHEGNDPHHVVRHVIVAARSHTVPEEFAQTLAEGHVATRAHELAELIRTRRVVREKARKRLLRPWRPLVRLTRTMGRIDLDRGLRRDREDVMTIGDRD